MRRPTSLLTASLPGPCRRRGPPSSPTQLPGPPLSPLWMSAHPRATSPEGWTCNRKRIQRLWRDEGLRLRRRARRRKKAPRTPGSVTATYPDHIWALAFVFDETNEGRPIKVLNITDEFTRQALACVAACNINADRTVGVFEELVEKREVTLQSIRCDNGSKLISAALRDWSRFNGVTTSYRARCSLAEPLRRIVQRQALRQAVKPRILRQSLRGPDAHRGLASGVQPLPAPPVHGIPRPGRVRTEMAC